MAKKGIYQAKISKVFRHIMVALSIIILIASILLILFLTQSNNHMLEGLLNVQINTVQNAINHLWETTNRFTTDVDIYKWLNSEVGSPDYYFYSLKAYKALSGETIYQNYDSTIAITTPDPGSFVITSSGTQQKSQFQLYSEKSATENGTFIPGTYKNKDSNGLWIVIKRNIEEKELLVICSLTFPPILFNDSYFAFAATDSVENVLISSFPSNLTEKLKEVFKAERNEFSFRGFKCIKRNHPYFGFSTLYAYANKIDYLMATLLLFTILITMAGMLLTLNKASNSLYEPVKNILEKISPGKKGGDEFKAIEDRCSKIEHLNMELQRATIERENLREKQKYRAFISGQQTEYQNDDSTSYFALAYVEATGGNAAITLAKLDTFSTSIPHLHSVAFSQNRSVLILKAKDKNTSKEKIMSAISNFLTTLNDDGTDIVFALPEPSYSYTSIKDNLIVASEILQYRYRTRNKVILTSDDIHDKSLGISFSFFEENKLISSLLSGSSDSLRIFDKNVEINLSSERGLLKEEQMLFAYIMVSIAMRIFQELKEEPKELIKREITWSSLYANKNPKEVLKKVREILSELISSLRERNSKEDNKTIIEMKKYINEHYMENIMLVDLAQAFNLTPKYCSSIFNQMSNDNFKSYLNNIRIQKACEIIKANPDIKISELSALIGFGSPNTFIRAFNRHLGITPKMYSEKVKNELKS